MGKRYNAEKRLFDELERDLNEYLAQLSEKNGDDIERTMSLSGSVRKQLWQKAARERKPLEEVLHDHRQLLMNAATNFAFDPLPEQNTTVHGRMKVPMTKPRLDS